MKRIPADFPVRPINRGAVRQIAAAGRDLVTCGVCGRQWNDAIPTAYTPAPGARCPFEAFHSEEDDERTRRQRAAEAARPSDLAYLEAARTRYGVEGSVEFDCNALLSRSEDPAHEGAYVQAWVWVDAKDAPEPTPDPGLAAIDEAFRAKRRR